MLDLVAEDDRNPIAAAWGRFEGCASLDDLGDKAWRRRVPHWGRASSMTYFMYRGYWIWLFPVSETTCSMGVVFDRRHVRPELGSPEELLAFLREHRALGEILGPSPRPLSYGSRARFARFARQQVSQERWFLTGNAGTVLDPMFASTSWLFTENNKLIGEFIKAERGGRGHQLPGMVHHFGIRTRSRYEKLLNSPGHYLAKGSFDTWSAWLALRNRVYYNRIVPDAFEDHRILLTFARTHGTDCQCDDQVMGGKLSRLLKSADRLTEEFTGLLDRWGMFYSGNDGMFLDSRSFDQDEVLMAKVHQRRDWALELPADERTYEIFCRTLVHAADRDLRGRLGRDPVQGRVRPGLGRPPAAGRAVPGHSRARTPDAAPVLTHDTRTRRESHDGRRRVRRGLQGRGERRGAVLDLVRRPAEPGRLRRDTGVTGSRTDCLAWVDANWTDMRPLSLRGAAAH